MALADSSGNRSFGDWAFLRHDYYEQQRCHLLFPEREPGNEEDRRKGVVRLFCEAGTVFGVLVYLTSAIQQGRRIGWPEYYKILREFPAKLIFHVSFIFVLAMIPLRIGCYSWMENIVAVLAMLSTSVHFLFFCRGIRFVGPFVLMLLQDRLWRPRPVLLHLSHPHRRLLPVLLRRLQELRVQPRPQRILPPRGPQLIHRHL